MPFWVPFAIAAGANIAGGAAAMYQASRMKEPKALGEAISKVENPNYYVPLMQRIYNSAQGDATIGKSLARQGMVGNEFLMRENLEANQAQSGEQVRQGVQGMEGQRLSMLERLLAQRGQFAMAKQQAQASALNQLISGVGGSAMAFGQANFQNQQFNAQQGMMDKQFTQQQAFNTSLLNRMQMPQLPMGGMPYGGGMTGYGG